MNERSRENLRGVHDDLARVIKYTVFPPNWEVVVTEGLRSMERQRKLLDEGKSWTMNSRHLSGHAVDIAIFIDGTLTWEFDVYRQAWDAIKTTADRLGIAVEWGGGWKVRDGTHFQLTWAAYPISPRQKTVANSKTIAAVTAGVPLTALVPEITRAIESFSAALSGFSEEWGRTIQLVLMMAISAFVIWERVQKMRQEGV